MPDALRGESFIEPANRLPGYLALTVSYIILGRLGLLLAVPPGYATAIFPPAGIAMGAVLIGGNATLPAILFGAFLLNIWIGLGSDAQIDALGLAAAAWIAGASVLQAAIGGRVLRRAIGYPAPLDNPGDLSRLLVLSPVCCLVSASISVGGLWLGGRIATPELARSWVTWWLGDSIGVMVMLPLVLASVGAPRALWRPRLRTVATPVLCLFTIFVVIFIRVSRWEQDQMLLEFRLLSQQSADRLRFGFEEQRIFLEQLARVLALEPAINEANFSDLVQPQLRRFPHIQAIEWAPQVKDADRTAFEIAEQKRFTGYTIHGSDGFGNTLSETGRDNYFPVALVVPERGNLPVLGLDLTYESERRAAITEALASGRVGATGPIPLVQDPWRQAGMLIAAAVPNGPSGTGVVLVALRIHAFIEGLLNPTEGLSTPILPMVQLRVTDQALGEVVFNGISGSTIAEPYREDFNFAGRTYRIETQPTSLYLSRHTAWESWAVLVAGLWATGLLASILMLATGHTHRVDRLIDARTRDLESANRRLRVEAGDREATEAKLRQAQRMEAVGQLTGGIAHDFNNLLTVVAGNAELLGKTATDDTVTRRLNAIISAAERGERLTRQLLSFSRRQTLRPETVNLRTRTHDIAEMLSRSLRDDIEVSVDLPETLWPVLVDLAEFELALLNIGVNARDAMPNGGRLTLAARNVALASGKTPGFEDLSGDFVALALSDTGFGMTPDILARVFEPYFTTKGVGAGSGLGLSQVYGFARQSGGAVGIESEPGTGTTVTLYLPRGKAMAERPISALTKPAASGTRPLAVLLVEDSDEVASVLNDILCELGHTVMRVRDAETAMAVVQTDTALHLVVSDIVMPGRMNGLDLARALTTLRLDLPVILATGYSDYAVQAVEETFILLEKPVRRDTLARAIETVLDKGPVHDS